MFLRNGKKIGARTPRDTSERSGGHPGTGSFSKFATPLSRFPLFASVKPSAVVSTFPQPSEHPTVPRIPSPRMETSQGAEASNSQTMDQLSQQVQALQTQLRLLQLQHCGSSVKLPREDGSNMRAFLAEVRRNCSLAGIESSKWAHTMAPFLQGDALMLWTHLADVGIDVTQWSVVEDYFVQQFCSQSREEFEAALARLRWTGNHMRYSVEFGRLVMQTHGIDNASLVQYYFAKLPDDLRIQLSHHGTVSYETWQEADAELRRLLGPLSEARKVWELTAARLKEANLRTNRMFRDEGYGGGHRPNGIKSHPDRIRNERAPHHVSTAAQPNRAAGADLSQVICRKCGGRGHFARSCPSRFTHPRASLPPEGSSRQRHEAQEVKHLNDSA